MSLPAQSSCDWPVVTAYCYLNREYGGFDHNGANPVHVGCGLDGEQVGYFSGGHIPGTRDRVELWLRLDPAKLAELPGVREAVEASRVAS